VVVAAVAAAVEENGIKLSTFIASQNGKCYLLVLMS
jgi:hypothetical protein